MGVCIVQEKADPSLCLPTAGGSGRHLSEFSPIVDPWSDAKYKVTRELLKPGSHAISVEQKACWVADYRIDCGPS
jgi:hypothetical protein